MKRFFLLSLILVITGCSAEKATQKTFDRASVASACASNVYLKRYGCSAEKVQQAAEQGDADAEYALGYMYYYGIGITSDPQTAQLWISKAAEQGQPLAVKAQSIIQGNPSATPATAVTKKTSPLTHHVAAKPLRHDMHDRRLQKNARPNSNLTATSKTSSNSSLRQQPMQQSPKIVVTEQSAQKIMSEKMPPSHENTAAASHVRIAPAKEKSDLSGYTIQLMGTYTLEDIKLFVAKYNLPRKLSVFETQYKGKPWFSLVYGSFQDRQSAKQAIKELPWDLRKKRPWVKSFKTIEQEVKQHQVLS